MLHCNNTCGRDQRTTIYIKRNAKYTIQDSRSTGRRARTGGADVLLRAGIDDAKLGDIDGARNEVGAHVGDERHGADVGHGLELHALDGLVVTVMHELGAGGELPGGAVGDGLVVALGRDVDLRLKEVVKRGCRAVVMGAETMVRATETRLAAAR